MATCHLMACLMASCHLVFSGVLFGAREHPQGVPRETCQPPSVSLQLLSGTVQPA